MSFRSKHRFSPSTTRAAGLLSRLFTSIRLTPLRIALTYLVFGFSALYVSDVLLVRHFTDPVLTGLQSIKGGVEIGATAILIYGLTTWHEYSLEQQTNRLARQREELLVLHRVFRHNLRNDLNVIHGYTTLLHDHTSLEQQHEWCQKVIAGVEDLMGYAERADQIHRITDYGTPAQPIDLTEMIPRILAAHPAIHDQVTITTELPDTASVAANHMLRDAVTELITHLITLASDTPTIHISVDPKEGPIGMTTLTITAQDTTIPTNVITVLEDAREDTLQHLDGLELWFVYWTIRESDGTITIDSTQEDTTLTIRLPHASLNPLQAA